MSSTDYLIDMLYKNKLIRWSDEVVKELKVYINPVLKAQKSDGENFFNELAMRALNTWKSALNNKINFLIVDNQKNANINIFWKWRSKFWYENDNVRGKCYYKWDNNHYFLRKADIKIHLTVNEIIGKEEEIFNTILHEIGHSLGLLEHSSNEKDIMFKHISCSSLSQRDINTIRLLYSLPCGDFLNENKSL